MAHLDLVSDLSKKEIVDLLKSSKENFSPLRRMQKTLKLSPACKALLFHQSKISKISKTDFTKMGELLKSFPLELKGPRPIGEAISSSGGVAWSEMTDSLMFKKFPGVFAAGEMLDWDSPTGGFLLTHCVSLGHLAARGILAYLEGHGKRP